MISTIFLILSILVVFNFFLLIFSCNKTSKPAKSNKKPRLVLKEKRTVINPTELQSRQLAPTGS